MPILDLQQRNRELGRIRIGKKSGGDKGHPQKLEKFRFTSPSAELITAIALLYGGECKPWNNDGLSQFEVFTTTDEVPILLPPEPVSQWYEMWSGGGCQRRCDGRTNVLNDSPCACPADHMDRALAAAKGRACKATTRLNVVLRDVPGIGVWRLESHGHHSALEIPMVAQFLAQAAEVGTYLPAVLGLSKRSSKRPGEGKKEWITPIIDVKETPRALMAGGTASVAIAEPNRMAALTASPERPDYLGLAADAVDLEAWREVWNLARTNGHLDPQLTAKLTARGETLRNGASSTPPGSSVELVDAEIVDEDEADRLWAAIVENAPWDSKQLEHEFASYFGGELPASASLAMLAEFLEYAKKQAAAA
jgi:hypothetical protein